MKNNFQIKIKRVAEKSGKTGVYLLWTFLFLLLCFPAASNAQQPAGKTEKNELLGKIMANDFDWSAVSISGKFKMKGLPLSPSVKIYMENEKLVYISLRAPLVGEVGRAEITRDSILVVNKMKKVYFKESLEEAMKYYPGTVGDIQQLILGRLMIPGGLQKELTARDEYLEVYAQEDEYAVVPGEDFQIEGFSYGYLVDPQGFLKLLLVVPDNLEDTNVTLEYEFYKKGYDIYMSYVSPEAFYNATMELDQPVFGANEMTPIKLNSKFRKVSISAFLQYF